MNDCIFRLFQGKLILLGGHAKLAFECSGKIAVVRKARGHAHSGELFLPTGNELTGAVDPDGIDIFLEALVQCPLNKMGQIAHGEALRLRKIRQANFVHIIFVHKPDEGSEALVPFFLADSLLPGDGSDRDGAEDFAEHQAGLTHTIKRAELLPAQVALGNIQQSATDGRVLLPQQRV